MPILSQSYCKRIGCYCNIHEPAATWDVRVLSQRNTNTNVTKDHCQVNTDKFGGEEKGYAAMIAVAEKYAAGKLKDGEACKAELQIKATMYEASQGHD